MAEIPEVELNIFVKKLNDATQREMTMEEAAQLEMLRAETAKGIQADVGTRRALQTLREQCCDLDKRRKAVQQLNEGRLGTHWRFALRNGRVTCEKKPVPVPNAMDMLIL